MVCISNKCFIHSPAEKNQDFALKRWLCHIIRQWYQMAIAKVLGVSIDLLEAFVADDENENKEIILFELRGDRVAARFYGNTIR